mmetsp:Transcript_708/g.1471  ORF Transcript_708/g.1471 Transcript_708/m.1471 type:complete len:221 (+) Transcript_708:338-1000(+)
MRPCAFVVKIFTASAAILAPCLLCIKPQRPCMSSWATCAFWSCKLRRLITWGSFVSSRRILAITPAAPICIHSTPVHTTGRASSSDSSSGASPKYGMTWGAATGSTDPTHDLSMSARVTLDESLAGEGPNAARSVLLGGAGGGKTTSPFLSLDFCSFIRAMAWSTPEGKLLLVSASATHRLPKLAPTTTTSSSCIGSVGLSELCVLDGCGSSDVTIGSPS